MQSEHSDHESSASGEHVLIVIGGDAPSAIAARGIDVPDRIVCADSGLDHALALGLRPDALIGDMDSISDGGRVWAEASGAEIISTTPDKDETDTELALRWAIERGASRITMLWGGGNRFDHVLGVMAAVAAPNLSVVSELRLWIAEDEAIIVHGPRALHLSPPSGSTISLVPVAGDVREVTTKGLRWNLTLETLWGGSARGVSNIVEGPVSISINHGVLAVIRPARSEEKHT
jgi:thiamine pyrophosphokinase